MSITITRDDVTTTLAKVHEALAPGRRKPLMAVLGRAAEKQYRGWFRTREADSPNKQGWPRQHFWSRLAKATAYDASRTTDSQAVVVISDPAINAKVHGGTWGAKEAKYLAIPLQPEAYGVRPKANTIPGLRFIPSQRRGNTVGWLAATDNTQIGGGRENLTYYWRLQRTVTVSPDSRALPPKADVMAALQARAVKFFFRPAQRGAAP